MCIGIPMQVVEEGAGFAWCEAMGERRRVDTSLVGDQPAGVWLLVFLDSAREVLDAGRAREIRDALLALEAVMSGSADIDHLFPDLADREPQLPEFLRERATE